MAAADAVCMDAMAFNLVTGAERMRRMPRARAAAKPRELTNDERADRTAAILTMRTPTLESCIIGYGRLK